MMTKRIKKVTEITDNSNILFITDQIKPLKDFGFSSQELDYLKQKNHDSKSCIAINKFSHLQYVVNIDKKNPIDKELVRLRNEGGKVWKSLSADKHNSITILDLYESHELIFAIIEGLILGSYQFVKYKTKKKDILPQIKSIRVISKNITQKQLDELELVLQCVNNSRDLVNETPQELTAEMLAKEAVRLGDNYGFKVKTLNKKKIEELKMGGLLAVNRGSVHPPTFSILEWKPEHPINQKPYILVGKGIVYDTGGINLKTSPGGLNDMKSDMGGAAAVIGALSAISANQLPVHIIGLIPATDNRPGYNAYVPGDVITMHSGQTVEVLNTDAEGRLILADALSYASRFKPSLTIDLATLTGSAVMAVGPYGIVAMGNADKEICDMLTLSGEKTGERIAWFPFWDEYDELIKSEVADMKNIGGREAGAITAGKFLSRFVDYDWIHFDIAGTAFLNKPVGYLNSGATGSGVRLLYNYFKNLCQ